VVYRGLPGTGKQGRSPVRIPSWRQPAHVLNHPSTKPRSASPAMSGWHCDRAACSASSKAFSLAQPRRCLCARPGHGSVPAVQPGAMTRHHRRARLGLPPIRHHWVPVWHICGCEPQAHDRRSSRAGRRASNPAGQSRGCNSRHAQAASLLPGLLAATRTGLPPAGDDELTNSKIRCYVTASPPALLGARKARARRRT
jgi:hypothetical protein